MDLPHVSCRHKKGPVQLGKGKMEMWLRASWQRLFHLGLFKSSTSLLKKTAWGKHPKFVEMVPKLKWDIRKIHCASIYQSQNGPKKFPAIGRGSPKKTHISYTVPGFQTFPSSGDFGLDFNRRNCWRHFGCVVASFVDLGMMLSSIITAVLLVPASAWADWCRWVPFSSQQYVPACRGYVYPGAYGGFGCANWCQWVPGPSWGYTSGCAGCYGLYSKHYKSVMLLAKQTGCEAGCQWVSRPTWSNTSDCNQCEQPVVLDSKTESGKTGLKVKMLDTRPDWCKWVPLSSLQYVGDCNGAVPSPSSPSSPSPPSSPSSLGQAYSCASWCTWVPATSWQYTSECRLCGGHGPVVPNATQGACMSFCQWVPMPSWETTPDCSQCAGPAGANQTANVSNSTEILP